MYRVIAILSLFALITGCASDPRRGGDQHGFMPGSNAILGPVKQYTAPYASVPRPKAEVTNPGDPVASVISMDASARAEAAIAGTSYLLGELAAHRLHTVILGVSMEDQRACAIIRPTGFPCVNIQEEQSVVVLGQAHPNG